MTFAAHLAAGLAIARAGLPWWATLLVAFSSHFILDLVCTYHPPGMHRPWLWPDHLRRVLLDEWQFSVLRYSGYGVEVRYPGDGRGVDDFVSVHPAAVRNLERWLLFGLNIAFVVFLPFGTWLGWFGWFDWLCAGIAWVGFDAFWAVRDLWPRLYQKVGWVNPHRLVDWTARLVWPSGKPFLWRPGAWCEFWLTVTLTFLAVFTKR